MAENPPLPLPEASRPDPPPSPAKAYYNQRHAIAASSERLRRLREAIADPVNLSSFQWAQWFAYTRELRPDLVIELGRGNGNSTAAVNEALRQLGPGRLVSLCLSRTWEQQTVPRLRPLVETDWFDSVDARVGNLLLEDFREIVGDARRILVIWDAHGFEIAACVLGHILPILAEREHFVIMHDISDLRYRDRSELVYGEQEIWQGMERAYRGAWQGPRICLGWVFTLVDQAISVVDFLTRNDAELQSADHSFHTEIGGDPERLREMERVLPKDDWSLQADWAYFTLNTIPGAKTYPRFARPDPARQAPASERWRDLAPGETLEVRATSSLELLRIVHRRAARTALGWVGSPSGTSPSGRSAR